MLVFGGSSPLKSYTHHKTHSFLPSRSQKSRQGHKETKADIEIDSSPWYKGRHHSGVIEQYLHLTSDKFGASHEEFQGIGMDDVDNICIYIIEMYADICFF